MTVSATIIISPAPELNTVSRDAVDGGYYVHFGTAVDGTTLTLRYATIADLWAMLAQLADLAQEAGSKPAPLVKRSG